MFDEQMFVTIMITFKSAAGEHADDL